jgi:hypothetical protein
MASDPIERASYGRAFPRVTDAVTFYVWREPAFHLARWAARANLAADGVRLGTTALCVLVFVLLWNGQYWWGLLAAFAFSLLEFAGRMLARLTGARSKWGERLADAVALIHPPLWWWAWEHGLTAYGRPLEPVSATMVLWAIVGGYVTQRAIEYLFMRRFGGLDIQRWRKVDSQFALVAADRNVNLLILTAALLFARPDSGLELVAWWTIASLIFHAVRLAQASEQAARGRKIASWLEG